MILDALGGRHPKEVVASGGREEFVAKMAAQLLRITRPFAPRPVVYRTYDFRTNEFRGLEGGKRHEPEEQNPMIGYRGCYRYIKDPETFALELETLGGRAGEEGHGAERRPQLDASGLRTPPRTMARTAATRRRPILPSAGRSGNPGEPEGPRAAGP